jgi:hypothetical protein
MLLFLATVLEQLDLAFEHVSQRDVHNARFGLMLTDNAIELILHQIAKDKAARIKSFAHRHEKYPHQAALVKALGRSFEAKVKLARLEEGITEEAAHTINIAHIYRNEIYHIGIQHEAILPSIAIFYFEAACEYIGSYKLFGLGWRSSQKLPERAQKYFHGDGFFPGTMEDFGNGCAALARKYVHDPAETIRVLAQHMDEVIEEHDTYIDIVTGGVYKGQQTTRDEAVICCQAWPLAFSEEGKAFAAKHRWTGNALQLVEWLGKNYPLRFRADPIASWEKQAARLRSQKNPHAALAHYHSFMTETATLREAIGEATSQVEAEIDAAIDRRRGK